MDSHVRWILVELIHRSFNRAGNPAMKEPSGLIRYDGKRSDGQTLIHWSG